MNVAASALALAFSAALTGLPVQATHATQVTAREPVPVVETVREQVKNYFADIPIMATIAGCESHYLQYDSNGRIYRGEINHQDVGVMQINEGYHLDTAQSLGLNIYTVEGNLAYARYLYDHEGTAPWSSSEYCWGGEKPQTASASPLASTAK
jgi:hypothetical protein